MLKKMMLKCKRVPALLQIDRGEDMYQIIKSTENVSKYMFPMIIQNVQYAEQLSL